jgi:hypothetical protein
MFYAYNKKRRKKKNAHGIEYRNGKNNVSVVARAGVSKGGQADG